MSQQSFCGADRIEFARFDCVPSMAHAEISAGRRVRQTISISRLMLSFLSGFRNIIQNSELNPKTVYFHFWKSKSNQPSGIRYPYPVQGLVRYIMIVSVYCLLLDPTGGQTYSALSTEVFLGQKEVIRRLGEDFDVDGGASSVE